MPTTPGQRPHFEEPPLVEAVFDLFAESGDPLDADVATRFFADLPDYASKPENWRQIHMAMQLERAERVSQTVDTSTRGVRRWNAARDRAVLVGPEVLAYNVLRPSYRHFPDHAPELQKLIVRFCEVARPARITRIGQRYINQVPVGLDEDAGDLFVLYPRLPQPFAKRHPPVQVRVETSRFENGVVVATLAQAKSDAREVLYVLDLHAQTTGAPGGSIPELVRWHEEAHEAIVGAFLAAITPRARERFKEKKDT